MIGMIQFVIYLVAAHLVLKGVSIVYQSLGQGRGPIQKIIAVILMLLSAVIALFIVIASDHFAQGIGTSIRGF
jgi:hypothetical protein